MFYMHYDFYIAYCVDIIPFECCAFSLGETYLHIVNFDNLWFKSFHARPIAISITQKCLYDAMLTFEFYMS